MFVRSTLSRLLCHLNRTSINKLVHVIFPGASLSTESTYKVSASQALTNSPRAYGTGGSDVAITVSEFHLQLTLALDALRRLLPVDAPAP